MRIDGPWADEQLGGDLLRRGTRGDQVGDLQLVRRQLVDGGDASAPSALARRPELALGSSGEPFGADRPQPVERASQPGAGVHAAVLPAEPFAVEQLRPTELGEEPTGREVVQGIAEVIVRGRPDRDQRGARRLGAASPRCVGRPGTFAKGGERSDAAITVAEMDGRFDDLAQSHALEAEVQRTRRPVGGTRRTCVVGSAVAHQGLGVVGEHDEQAFAAVGGVRHGVARQSVGELDIAAERGQMHVRVLQRRDPDLLGELLGAVLLPHGVTARHDRRRRGSRRRRAPRTRPRPPCRHASGPDQLIGRGRWRRSRRGPSWPARDATPAGRDRAKASVTAASAACATRRSAPGDVR